MKMMKGNRRFKASNCRGGCVSRKFRGSALPARRDELAAVSTRESKRRNADIIPAKHILFVTLRMSAVAAAVSAAISAIRYPLSEIVSRLILEFVEKGTEVCAKA
jgi:hypothetical protein